MSAWQDRLLTDTPGSRREARLGALYRSWLQFRSNRLALLGLGIVVLLIVVAAFAPWIATHHPNEQNLAQRLLAPSGTHWLGTDEFGRDVFSRIVYGARITLYIVALVAIIAAPIGLIVGTAAGYLGGWVDAALMRITDVFLAFPSLILALAFVAALGPGIENAVIAIALTAWPPYARIARAETLTIRNADYIAAARLQGASTGRILSRHIMPLCLSSLTVRVTLDMAGMVATIPGVAIFAVSLAFNLLGDGLRDVLDPRQKK
ncbi:MAG: peptide/nickel transport system permease protein [Xanthobacteraceae bacterium]|nr:MAG: peptide/nickel transport system permease protein [Xanthobacteraceae bacterium]